MEHAREQYEVSERRACRVLRQGRGTQRYLPLRRTDEDQLTQAILALAAKYGRYGYRRITVHGKLRDEFLNGEIFYSLKEAQMLTERWRVEYNTERPHSALGYRPPAPQAILPKQLGHGDIGKRSAFPTSPPPRRLRRTNV